MFKNIRLATTGLFLVMVMLLTGCQASSDQPGTASNLSATDQANYDAAMTLSDATYCDKITDGAYKNLCQNALVDGQQLQAALSKVDAGLCVKISSEDKQNACKVQVEVIMKQNQEREDLKNEITKNDELAVTIIAGKDYTRCKELTLDSSKADCEYNILANKAIESKDATLCDKLSNQEQKAQCHDAYNKVHTSATDTSTSAR